MRFSGGDSSVDKIHFGRIIGVAILCVAGAACAETSHDTPGRPGTGGQSDASGGAAGVLGAAGSGGSGDSDSGGSRGAGGSAEGGAGISAGALGAGGVTGTAGVGSSGAGTKGSGGVAGTSGGGRAGTSGAAGAEATGCHWLHDTTNDTWSFDTPAPANTIVLFDGTSIDQWHKQGMPGVPISWQLVAGGAMQVVTSGTGKAVQVQSNMAFNDVCLHVEYLTAPYPANTTDIQKRGNSGVYLRSAYEMQILDTHDLPPLIDGCGAVYKVSAPLVVACYMYSVWNTYEIEFKASVWDNSTPPRKIKDAVFVQVALNGKLVQRNVDLNLAGGSTEAGIPDSAGPQPIGLQDHLDPDEFRNIWVTIPQY